MILPYNERVCFFGAGSIAEVWIERLLSSGAASPEQVMACDIRPERPEALRLKWNLHTGAKNSDGAGFATIAVLAVPPADALPVLKEVRGALRSGTILVSLAAAVGLDRLEQATGDLPVIRVMPNTPALVGEAMNLVAFGSRVSRSDRSRIEALLDLFGMWFEVPDEEFDFWCALCAVGPTYVLPVMQALVSAAVARGLPAEKALKATTQVFRGTARMVEKSNRTMPELKQMISLRTLREEETKKLFTEAYEEAVDKLGALTRRLALSHAAGRRIVA